MEYLVTWLYVIVKNAGCVSERFLMNFILLFHYNWAATWQNQQSECASSEDSDQPGHLPSLVRVFAVRMKKPWVLSYPLSEQRRLIRLGGCPGWSEPSLGAHLLCWLWYVVAHIIIIFAWFIARHQSHTIYILRLREKVKVKNWTTEKQMKTCIQIQHGRNL